MIKPITFKGKHTSADLSWDSQLVQSRFKSNLLKKFQCLYEGTAKQGNPTLLNEIYTELYITESESGEINNEHEVRQIETQSRKAATEDTPIKCNDIFRPLPGQDKPIRTVVTKGVAGIGKTVSVQKFIVDWAEGKENQDAQLIFPLPFRELNLMKDKTLSLSDLLHLFFPETKEMEIFSDEYKVLFIFDGLDECRLSLNFKSKVKMCNISESASVDVLLINLIVGNLLPSALIWITSRPAAADFIPSEFVHRVTEVRGFNEPQKKEYFRKRISDHSLANKIITHLKSSRSLHIMCHIPVFCWISATVLGKMFCEAESGEIPKTLTQMYTHFLILQTSIKHEKDYEKKDEDMIAKLGKLSFQQLVKGNLIFYEEDLRECGIDVTEASVYSGLCTQIFREEFGLYQGKVFCFVHLSIQEHLAALYAHIYFIKKNRNVFFQITKPSLLSKVLNQKKCHSISEFHQRAVDEALQSKNGNLHLFLRFLLGLSLESSQTLLRELLTKTGNCSYNKEETVQYIKQKIRENRSPERSIILFHCLNELGDDSLVQEIQDYLTSGKIRETKLSSSQWSALVYVLLTSEQKMDVFDLKKFTGAQNTADEILQKLLPVVKESRSVQLIGCGVTDEGCAALASALRSNPSHMRELSLSGNKIGASGVNLLSDGLKDPHCKLETMWLSYCGVTDEGCAALASALRSNLSHLRKLDLTGNKLGDSGVNLLSDALKDLHCKLNTLGLIDCGVTDEGCAAPALALRSNPSHLRKLSLSLNKLKDSGVNLLSAGLKDPQCKLEKLWLSDCDITNEGCAALGSALRSNPHLRELDLSWNKLRDSGVNLLSDKLKDPHCKLEILKLYDCGLTDEGCAALASVLRSNPSHLRDLDLKGNKLGDSGVNLLSDGLKDPHCKLEKLKLSDCGVTDEGCAVLASALRSKPSHLRELDLSLNKLRYLGVKLLSDLKDDPHYKLEVLKAGPSVVELNEAAGAIDQHTPHEQRDFYYDTVAGAASAFPVMSMSCDSQLVQSTFKSNLLKKFQCLNEGTAKQGNPTLLNEIYTELYITESESGEINNEHEVRQIETQSRRATTEDTPIKCNDIFRPLPGQDKPIRTVLTKGVAGIGKTVSVQKFIVDWAEGKENQDIQLIFPLPFRELNLMKDKTLNLSGLLYVFFPETKEMEISSEEYKVLFIFDGLDECRLSLNFKSDVKLCNISESASVDVLLMNLIVGNLLPSALIWITSRPAAADLVPSECVHRVTEVRGFNEPQKEEYFRKRISDQSLANTIITCLKSSRSLHIMCHIPVFCWISATFLEKMLSEAESGEIPKTLTQMYTHFLIIQTNIKHEKDYEKKVKDEDMILKLGKLAFQQLVKGNLIFYEEDLRECGIDVTEASVYSGLCSQIFREELGLYQAKVFCFVHLSIQEHLAALYAHHSFTNNCKTLNPLSELHQRALKKALKSKSGHLDLFLQFLLGLSLESNQTLLRELLTQTGSCSYNKEETVQYIKQMISENCSPERSINLFHCLNELGDDSLMRKIQRYLKSGEIRRTNLSSLQWSALVYVLLTSEQMMDVFDLKQFIGAQHTANEVLQKLLPVVKESRSVQLSNCGITDEGCRALASALRSNPSHLRELDLSFNNLTDQGVNLLYDRLKDPDCKIETLGLSYCGVTDEGFAALASALRSNPSHLRKLDLSGNKPGASGVNLLSEGLTHPHCKLEKLCLSNCGVKDEGCAALASVLRLNPSHLRELNLTANNLKDSGVKLLSIGLKDPHCKLEILWLRLCGVTGEGCPALVSVLRSNPSHLRELDLSWNNLRDSGVKLFSKGLKNRHCKLEKLWLSGCGVTDEGCATLASALRSNPSHLRELDLALNPLGDSGVKLLSDILKDDPHCKLELVLQH
ncbi:NACHT, LRR and PYD domains-containing protein 12 [Anabarilius grahami]|uniref:NACHT, LRR and PYD domains-containing protein 12 n=1 Tax=Anabarilius grahami TaxID=495550 RepID=A0A3N0Y0V8_ANAGA|nr:NACHT, LRR and PYD domains-containing protein 12 [Anabarilius grahami]